MKRAWVFPFMVNVPECVRNGGVGLLATGYGCSCCPSVDLQLNSSWSEAVFYVILITEFLQSLILLTSTHQFCLIMCFLEKNVWPAASGVDVLYRSGLLTVIIQINPFNFVYCVSRWCTCVYTCPCVCMWVYIPMCPCVGVHAYICTYVGIYAYVYRCVGVHAHVYMYVYMPMCGYMCSCVCAWCTCPSVHVCGCTCSYVHVCDRTCPSVHEHECISMCTCAWAYMLMCMCGCTYVWVYVSCVHVCGCTYMPMWVYISTCMCVFMSMCTCVWVYMPICSFWGEHWCPALLLSTVFPWDGDLLNLEQG